MVEVKKLWIFFTIFSMRARPSAEIRGLFTIFSMRARPSAEISVVEVQKLRAFYDFLQAARDPLPGSCVSKRSRCGAVRICCSRNGLWKLSRGSRACFRNPAVAGSIPPWSAAAPA